MLVLHSLLASSESPSPVIETLRGSASMDSLWSPQNRVRGLLTQTIVGVEKLASKTRFPSGEFLPIRVFLLVSGCLRACHRWLRSHVEEPHQSFQVLCHSS